MKWDKNKVMFNKRVVPISVRVDGIALEIVLEFFFSEKSFGRAGTFLMERHIKGFSNGLVDFSGRLLWIFIVDGSAVLEDES